MREHKFRGKRVDDGGIVYGDLGSNGFKNPYIHNLDNGEQCFQIFPESVSEFTGLFDKNGTEVYENDILKNNRGHYFRVVWEDWGWVLQRLNVNPVYGEPAFVRGSLKYLEKVESVEGMILLEDPDQLKMFEEESE